MQPARINLPVYPGTTFRDTMRLMQPDYAYRPISSISGAPAQLAVPDHGLTADWPVWVRGVSGLPAINREPPLALPHRARFLDADALEINGISAAGTNPQGGQLLYRLPVDLAGATVLMTITGLAGDNLELSFGAGLANPAPGTLTRELTPEQTALLLGDWRYLVTITFADGSVIPYFEGGQAKPGGCHG